MAKAKRNIKTHPKVRDEQDTDTFVDPSREDQLNVSDTGRSEMVDVFATDQGANAGGVDMDSAVEGDGRGMSQEGEADAGDSDRNTGSVRSATQGDAGRGSTGAADAGDDYSTRVRKRISRERALVNRERNLREQTQRELAEERSARQALTERLDRIERAQTEVTGNADVKALQSKIDALAPQIAAATEGGDTKKALELQIQLGDLQGDLKILKYDLQRKAEVARVQSAQSQQAATQRATDTTVQVDPEAAESAERFKRANRHWWNRSGNKQARDDAVTIDVEVLGDIRNGELDFQPYSDEHWEEVARRLHESYPNLEIQDLEGAAYQFDEEGEGDDMNQRGNGRQQQRRSIPTPPMRGAQQNGRRTQTEVDLARNGKVTLNEKDFNTMRTFKMDPNNPTDKKYFAQEKRRSILNGERQSGGNRNG